MYRCCLFESFTLVLSFVLALLVSSGCRSTYETDAESARYLVQTVVLEAQNETDIGKLNGVEETLDDFASRTDGIIRHQFHDFVLSHGEKAEADEREPVEYKRQFDLYRKSEAGLEMKSGWLIRVALSVPRLSMPQLVLGIENTEVVKWKQYKGRDGNIHRYPVLRHRKLHTTVFPEPGRWLRVSDLTGVTESANRAFFVRVRGPLKAEHDSRNDRDVCSEKP